jgi:hypothetical protein
MSVTFGNFALKSRAVKVGRLDELTQPDPLQNALVASGALLFNTLPQPLPLAAQPSVSSLQAGVANIVTKQGGIILSGVNSIRGHVKTGSTSSQGLAQSMLQPWYVQPTELTIKASSYLGAIALVSPSDTDVADILSRLYQTLDEFARIANTKYIRMPMVVEIDNQPYPHNRLVGFINDFDYEENEAEPFFFNYTMVFEGKPDASSNVSKGKQASVRDSSFQSPS